MGGVGSGGKRTRPGPKPGTPQRRRVSVDDAARTAKHRPRVRPPAGLTAEQLAIWKNLSPHAHRLGTLTVESASAFLLLVQLLQLADDMRARLDVEGLTYEKRVFAGEAWGTEPRMNPLVAAHRNTIQRAQSLLSAFGLQPDGRPMPEPATKADPAALERAKQIERFFGRTMLNTARAGIA